MCYFLMPRCSCLVACVVVVAIAAQVGLAASAPSRAPEFIGQLTGEASPPSEPLSLWYRQPAALWTSALPVGNGRQAAMMFGGVDSEVICLNEDTLWAGGPYTPDNPDALKVLPEVRRLLFDGQYRQAEGVISRNMMGRPSTQAPYQPVGDLLLTFPMVETAEDYRRDLNLRTATATVRFTSGGTTFTRELFASAPDNVLVLRLTAGKPGQIVLNLSMQTGENITDSNGTEDTFILNGTNPGFAGVAGALRFQTRAKILHSGGTLTKSTREIPPAAEAAGGPGARGFRRGFGRGGGRRGANQSTTEYFLEGADTAVVLIASATSYKKFDDVTGNPDVLAAAMIDEAVAKGYDALRKDQLADHQSLFERVSLDLGTNRMIP